MGVLLSFLVGWSVGARMGAKGYAEVIDAAKAVKDSEEFDALVALTRTHVAATFHELSKLVSGATPLPEPLDVLERVQRLTSRRSR